jgi:hypothetical protein
MDLGIVVPLSIMSGILLMKKNNYGYLLSSVVIIKGVSLLTSLSFMIISLLLSGVSVNIIEIVLFGSLNIFTIICFLILLKNIKK